MKQVVMKWQSHTRDEQGESDWYFNCEIITKTELGLQGTQDGCLKYRNASVSRAGLKVAMWCLRGRVKGCTVRG